MEQILMSGQIVFSLSYLIAGTVAVFFWAKSQQDNRTMFMPVVLGIISLISLIAELAGFSFTIRGSVGTIISKQFLLGYYGAVAVISMATFAYFTPRWKPEMQSYAFWTAMLHCIGLAGILFSAWFVFTIFIP